ncbi:uncharacterized protein SCHCODRAFT_02702759 [Schizophyllum commune H4-8]|uniref:Uncharacterized protein n=1 Tax=Schizophyllum commune (strain H4-8 / FGSC 9210) TaxID=578458 RepID=D8QA64_SCHCM|nr:uncharacterized protein SCHCODRAFT_02702759 [Schizophyllum commune H4-8]KAI5890129.1 hypothetical protein SCHCODRAFT_02702759 [Schizophyllum commune H4-8]
MSRTQRATDTPTMAFHDNQTIELPAFYTLPYNTPSSLELQDRLDEEFDTLSAFGTADFAILYLPRNQRLVTSRPTKLKTRLAPTVEEALEEASGDSPVCDAPPAYCKVEASDTPPTFTSPSERTIAQLAADAAIREKDEEDALRPVPTPDEILQRAREQEAAEEAALESFYAKFPALAALRPSPPRMPATGLLTPPPTPPTSRIPKGAARMPSFITMEKSVSKASSAVYVPPSSSALDKRMSTAPPTPVSAPRKPVSKIPRKKNKENTVQPAGRQGKSFTVKIDVTVDSSRAGGSSKASGPVKAPTALKVKKRENDGMPAKGRMTATAGKSGSPPHAPSKYGAQAPLDRKSRQHSAVVGRPATRVM